MVEHDVIPAVPLTLHATAPTASIHPSDPVTVAVNVTLWPNVGLAGTFVTTFVGVALTTVPCRPRSSR